MSDIGRLFGKIGTALQTPIENFTTEALAIAIEHDDAPMRRALKEIAWSSKVPPFDVEHVARVEPLTQTYLPVLARDLANVQADWNREGYLDLVLMLTLESAEKVTAWVEVKVDSPESGAQLDVYAEHARHQKPSPVIFTLSKSEIRPAHLHPKDFEIGWLSWQNLATAIEAQGSVEHWKDLFEFLREEQLAWPPMPCTVVDPEPYLSVLVAVNNRIREQWPTYEIAWFGKNPAKLKTAACAEYRGRNRIIATAGPLTYGLVPFGKDWVWSVSVGCPNYQHVALNPGEIVRQADHVELSGRWERLGTRHTALEARIPLEECSAYEQVTTWFADALRELDEREILRGFFDGLDAKRAKSALLSV